MPVRQAAPIFQIDPSVSGNSVRFRPAPCSSRQDKPSHLKGARKWVEKIRVFIYVMALVGLLALPQALITSANDDPLGDVPTPTPTPIVTDGWDPGWGG